FAQHFRQIEPDQRLVLGDQDATLLLGLALDGGRVGHRSLLGARMIFAGCAHSDYRERRLACSGSPASGTFVTTADPEGQCRTDACRIPGPSTAAPRPSLKIGAEPAPVAQLAE